MITNENIAELCEPFNVVILQLMEYLDKLESRKQANAKDDQWHNDFTRATFYLSQTQNYRTFLIQDLNSNLNKYTLEACKRDLRRDQNYFESYVTELNHVRL
jgi:hypothetical protein